MYFIWLIIQFIIICVVYCWIGAHVNDWIEKFIVKMGWAFYYRDRPDRPFIYVTVKGAKGNRIAYHNPAYVNSKGHTPYFNECLFFPNELKYRPLWKEQFYGEYDDQSDES